jgi:hypothetical protein
MSLAELSGESLPTFTLSRVEELVPDTKVALNAGTIAATAAVIATTLILGVILAYGNPKRGTVFRKDVQDCDGPDIAGPVPGDDVVKKWSFAGQGHDSDPAEEAGDYLVAQGGVNAAPEGAKIIGSPTPVKIPDGLATLITPLRVQIDTASPTTGTSESENLLSDVQSTSTTRSPGSGTRTGSLFPPLLKPRPLVIKRRQPQTQTPNPNPPSTTVPESPSPILTSFPLTVPSTQAAQNASRQSEVVSEDQVSILSDNTVNSINTRNLGYGNLGRARWDRSTVDLMSVEEEGSVVRSVWVDRQVEGDVY